MLSLPRHRLQKMKVVRSKDPVLVMTAKCKLMKMVTNVVGNRWLGIGRSRRDLDADGLTTKSSVLPPAVQSLGA